MSAPAPADPAPAAGELSFPQPVPPAPGEIRAIAEGILWLRLALPFALDHVNIYLIADGDGWAVLDTGVADLRTRAVWEGVMRTHRITRVIATHFHPDHVGSAGWLVETARVPFAMSRTEYDFARGLRHDRGGWGGPAHLAFYTERGIDPAMAHTLITRGHNYLKLTTDLPAEYQRLRAGEAIDIGSRRFEVLTGGGHALEQVMLFCREGRLLLVADQVLARISPNIGVWHGDPEADPLGEYLESLAALHAIPDDVLVLSAHNLPFRGLHARLDQLARHHKARCDDILLACANTPQTVAEILPVLFPRQLDAQQLGFAFAEALAHVNFLLRAGALARHTDAAGVQRVRSVDGGSPA